MTLYLYIGRKFLKIFLGVFAGFYGIAFLLDIVEQVRQFSGTGVSIAEILHLALLKTPEAMYAILPLVMILATLALFLGLARSSELVVIRASGRSAIRSLASPVIVALFIGVVSVAAYNPIVATTKQQYEKVAQSHRQTQQNTMSVSSEGLWLRQVSETQQSVVRASEANLDGTELWNTTFINFDDDGDPVVRIEAAHAKLMDGYWELYGIKKWPLQGTNNPERDAELLERMDLQTDLTRDQIRDSFGTPNAISIWELPAFIDTLERAGFSALKHRVWLNRELAMPIMFVAMVLIGAGFTMRHTRFGRTGTMVLFSILLGFSLFFIRDFVQIFGENGQVPVLLATWSPPVVAISIAVAILLHMEDG
ncbi:MULTISPECIES: LPS export ABC transporter permease LptG [Halocynthiibacter]|uniref:LPS export ABC transporter permease LptG n=1 Tax=Halocynthiibacter halioticoli TaxID=2986804 RepID=A0AAE3J1V5_9RHOB|nr:MULTISPECIES: LPS export ABC transporter permease LptG [Halocynthiibacter]MCV6824611.1 LPS export ABC transporter permease LptG [Halocynthiibacter halioticoli]MCW4057612.1 LPS export ABC transporter permease LptG [Halocynthiibacter sp. SDUM655004]